VVKYGPAAEVDVSSELVRELVDTQFPEYAQLPLELIGNGWDNSMYRLGDNLSVRLPRRKLAAPLILSEQTWLPEIAKSVPISIPAPIGCGVPTADYPWRWSILEWFPGETAFASGLHISKATALADFLIALHQPAPANAPDNAVRGVPLMNRYQITITNIETVSHLIEPVATKAAWDKAVRVAEYSGPPVWLHGDLHPLNIITAGGEITAIIDFGDITSGDPATDIAVAWMLFDARGRSAMRQRLGCDGATWERGRGWAISLSLAYLAHSADHPLMGQIGHRTLEAALGSHT
jgi:aminoglycoside phosphotransferase (APT) family kinase protein